MTTFISSDKADKTTETETTLNNGTVNFV